MSLRLWNEKRMKKDLKASHIQPIDQVIYGKTETKQGIANVVSKVFSEYKFTSLPEFNAILKQFNVLADRGDEEGRIFKTGGLHYRMLDESGQKIGVPIKASSLPLKPTLKNLQAKFEKNKKLREQFKDATRISINKVLVQHPISLKEFSEHLKKEGIYLLERRSAKGEVYGLTYVDNIAKVVFNGSDLGKQYSAKAITGRIGSGQLTAKVEQKNPASASDTKSINTSREIFEHEQQKTPGLIDSLLYAGNQPGHIPFQLKKKTKKKKRNNNL